jgi:hypothetical protein
MTPTEQMSFRQLESLLDAQSAIFDRDAELKIWLAGVNYPVEKELKKGTDVVGVQKTLARHILK